LIAIRPNLKNAISGDVVKFISSTRLHGITSQDDSIRHRHHRENIISHVLIYISRKSHVNRVNMHRIPLFTLTSTIRDLFSWQSYILLHIFIVSVSRDSSAGIATGYGAGWPRSRSSIPGRIKNFLFSTTSTPALGPTQLPIQWVPGVFFPGGKAAVAWSWPFTSN
jgi:hypothetical protein